eukprot:1811884-Lingulodinium_polyedra.AAC.1
MELIFVKPTPCHLWEQLLGLLNNHRAGNFNRPELPGRGQKRQDGGQGPTVGRHSAAIGQRW